MDFAKISGALWPVCARRFDRKRRLGIRPALSCLRIILTAKPREAQPWLPNHKSGGAREGERALADHICPSNYSQAIPVQRSQKINWCQTLRPSPCWRARRLLKASVGRPALEERSPALRVRRSLR